MESVVFGFRRLFYAITPKETSFPTVEDVPNYVDEAIPYFISLMFLEVVILSWQGRQLPRINDAVSSLSNGLMSLMHSLLFRSTELVAFLWVYNRFNIVTLPWDNPITWVLGFLGVDFGYYWVHRCGHEVNIMWAGHQAHHSSEEYNLTTALRQSAVHRYILWMFYLPLALFMPPSIFLVHVHFNLIYQFWIHTEVIRNVGPLELILNTPSHHRVHHGRNRYCIDKNYGGTLIIWDRLFGTFEPESEEVVYGLVHPLNSWDLLYAQFCQLTHIARMVKKLDGLGNKLSAILKGPGWEPGKPRLGLPEDLPEISSPVAKYDSDLPPWTKLYVVAHFGILLFVYQELGRMKQLLSTVTLLSSIVGIIFTLSCFGALFDHRKGAPFMEFLRCVLVLVLWLGLLPWLQDEASIVLLFGNVIYYFFVLSVIIWGYICLRQYSVSIKKK